jgi:hypothetical protein
MSLFNIIKTSQYILKGKCASQLLKEGYTDIVYKDGYLYAKGDIPILLVAHLDTVHRTLPSNKTLFCDKSKGIIWSPDGVGGDDRCGVFAILEIIKEFKPHVLFCEDEEIGGIGAHKVLQTLDIPDVKFIIELDRSGYNDSVFYDCNNKDFQQYINTFGFETDWGTFSDISIFAPSWNIAAVNLSVGYYNEHSKEEYINLKHMYSTINKVKNILKDSDTRTFDFQKKVYNWETKYIEYQPKATLVCANCDAVIEDHAHFVDGLQICEDCFEEYFE